MVLFRQWVYGLRFARLAALFADMGMTTGSTPTTFTLGKGRIFLLVLVFVLVWIAGMIHALPANWVWQWVSPRVTLPPFVKVEAVGGSVWDGTALLEIEGRPMRLAWGLGVGALAQGEGRLEWQLETLGSRVQGEIRNLGTRGVRLEAGDSQLALTELNRMIPGGGLRLSGVVDLERLRLNLQEGQWTNARALARWSGGPVSWNLPTGQGQAILPPLVARVREEGTTLVGSIREAENDQALVVARLEASGQARVEVFRRFPELADIPVPGEGPADQVVFRVQRKLF